ncbi:MAG: 1-acyl-sn-glycerol-3-phosphate acyltransferase [Muribaculaceae bacterium]|nr:1-acyl-sn-glycerol-3-phosphate acyltransferase [Muribaculaceae bacterium]
MIVLYRIYQFLIAFPLLFVATVLAALSTILLTSLGIKWGAYYPAHWWARLFCWLNLVTVSVKGHDNVDRNTSYVFVANHQGAFDIFSIYGFLGHDFKWMMKKSLRNIPLVGYSCYRAGHIFVDRSSRGAVRATMEQAEKRLKGGASLVVFPEGARTWDGHMRQFKKGAYQLALEFNLPLVPVSIDGAYDVMSRTMKLPRWGHISLTIHKPIEPPADVAGREAVMETTADAIRSALPDRFK